jgi:tetratricopeptide (TPR) repeat protein
VLKENPDNKHAQYLRALINQRSGRPAEALRVFEQLYKEDRALAGAALGYAYGKAGRTREAQQILAQMQELAKQRYVPQQEFAIIYVGLGEYDNAFAALEKAYDERFAGLIYLRLEPIFSSLRSDPRFESLAKRMDLPNRPANP